jgi:hypothetical protein
MPNRNTSHEQNKLDHSTHPTTRSTKDDLRAPGGAPEQPSAGADREKPRVQRQRKSGGR